MKDSSYFHPWPSPRPQDSTNFLDLIQICRHELDARVVLYVKRHFKEYVNNRWSWKKNYWSFGANPSA